MNKYNNILELKDKFDIFIFDAYGVFWDGGDFYNGSREAMEYLVKIGKTVYILSNAAGLSESVSAKYDKRGLKKGIHYHEIISSGTAARHALENREIKELANVKNVYQFGAPNDKLFSGLDYVNVDNLKDADFIYVSTPLFNDEEKNVLVAKGHGEYLFESMSPKGPRKWNTTKLEVFEDKVKELLARGIPILNANPDLSFIERTKDGIENLVICQGSIASLLRKGGAKVIELGKPNVAVYEFVFNTLKKSGIDTSDKSKICMIGDTLRTDIKGANNAGIKSVLCVETGITANKLRSAKLEDLIKEEDVIVDYTIKGIGFNINNV
jgi:HAD superfamily hydrolase (TIGR01450 family)